MKKPISVFLAFTFLLLATCSSNAPVAKHQAGSLIKESVVTIKEGTITSVKNVTIMGRKGNAVGTVGSVTGSILGASGTIAGSLIGSMIGGAIGSEADKALSKQKGVEITLALSDGQSVTVTQLAKTEFNVGDKVQLIMQDNKAQVAHLQSDS